MEGSCRRGPHASVFAIVDAREGEVILNFKNADELQDAGESVGRRRHHCSRFAGVDARADAAEGGGRYISYRPNASSCSSTMAWHWCLCELRGGIVWWSVVCDKSREIGPCMPGQVGLMTGTGNETTSPIRDFSVKMKTYINLKFEITRCDKFVIFVTADRSEIEW